MKKAFDSYFERLLNYSMKTFGTKPTVSYSDDFPKDLLVSSPDEDGEVEWLPKLQVGAFDWSGIEAKLGFTLNQELKAYYSTYSFLNLAGKIDRCYLYFQPVPSRYALKKIVWQQFIDAQEVFPQSQIFILGNAAVEGMDDFFLYYNNITSKSFCFESDRKKTIPLNYSLPEIIDRMEAII